MSFSYFMPARILFGNGALDELSACVLPGKKALVVTGGSSVKKFGYLNKLTAQLKIANREFEIFDKILPNPIAELVGEGAAAAKKAGCDFVIGLGGGSSIDSAKAIAIAAANDGELWDYVIGGSGRGETPPNKPLPVIAIPTTSGTGTEADPWAVISNGEEKIGLGFDGTFPFLSIVDPSLTLSVPARLTAFQGFDALFHATESYINKNANPISDMFCEKAISLIGASLPAAVSNPNDLAARENMSLASLLAGFTETLAGCTSCHSLEHALSAAAPSLEHGAGLIILSAEYYRYFIEEEACPERFIKMAKLLGVADPAEPLDFVTVLSGLITACRADSLKLSDYGIKRDDLKKITDIAYDTMGGLFDCDRVRLEHKNAVKLYEKVYR
jgi:alcohol dehydrogenase